MNRNAAQIRRDLEKTKRQIESASEAEGQIEELEFELAQETAVLFLLMSERFVPEDKDEKTKDWEYEVLGVSEETAFTKLNMRLQVKDESIQVRFYDMDEHILTVYVNPNERIRITVPYFSDPGEYEFVLNGFKTRKDAEDCQAFLELHQRDAANIGIN